MVSCRRIVSVFLLLSLFSGCASPLSLNNARATAIVGGCWPYGVPQPQPSPTRSPVPLTMTPTIVPLNATATIADGPWVSCTPVPGVPTSTPTSTPIATARPRETPQPPGGGGSSGLVELGDAPGRVGSRSITTQGTRAVSAWTTWGTHSDNGLPVNDDGIVWVRAFDGQRWQTTQSINTAPVWAGDLQKLPGGVAALIAPDGTFHVIYGAGGINGDLNMYVVTSSDGERWSLPTRLGLQGNVLDAAMDSTGRMHVLFVARPADHVAYAYGSSGQWSVEVAGSRTSYRGSMAIFENSQHQWQRAILIHEGADPGSAATLYQSIVGGAWTQQPLGTNQFFPEQIWTSSIVGHARADGDVLAVVWCQYGKGGVFAQVSTDGGSSWGEEERIGQHRLDGSMQNGTEDGTIGIDPHGVYDPASDSLVVSWVEQDGQRSWGAHMRTVMSSRSLQTPLSAPNWQHAQIPDDETSRPIELTGWGLRGMTASDGEGNTMVLITDERNDQFRLFVQTIHLPFYFVRGNS